jgi:hypothetical protein
LRHSVWHMRGPQRTGLQGNEPQTLMCQADDTRQCGECLTARESDLSGGFGRFFFCYFFFFGAVAASTLFAAALILAPCAGVSVPLFTPCVARALALAAWARSPGGMGKLLSGPLNTDAGSFLRCLVVRVAMIILQ